ncbi:MAG: hypothetical protein FJ304_28090 [Planctomycetes bacterium]|nr:hypothetical protein [Planctomycetota bacterium]
MFDNFDRLFVLASAGLGLVLAGGLNLAFGRGTRRVWLRAAATVGVCGAVLAAGSLVARPVMVARAGGAMFGVLLLAFLFGSDWLARQVSGLVAAFRAPATRWGLVAAGGLAVAGASVVNFDRAEQAAADEATKNLEMALGRPPSKPNTSTRAATDRGTQIVLKEPVAARPADELNPVEERTIRDFPHRDQLIRRGGPSDHANCHGWVFTGGKFMLSPDDVEQIVKENGYTETHEPHAGDLVVYRQGGSVAHTAIVRYVTEGQPVMVEGKWGTMGVFLHPADKSCYGQEYTFYRSARGTHLLVGVGGSPAAPGTAGTVTAE